MSRDPSKARARTTMPEGHGYGPDLETIYRAPHMVRCEHPTSDPTRWGWFTFDDPDDPEGTNTWNPLRTCDADLREFEGYALDR